jgi:hypothetical protein
LELCHSHYRSSFSTVVKILFPSVHSDGFCTSLLCKFISNSLNCKSTSGPAAHHIFTICTARFGRSTPGESLTACEVRTLTGALLLLLATHRSTEAIREYGVHTAPVACGEVSKSAVMFFGDCCVLPHPHPADNCSTLGCFTMIRTQPIALGLEMGSMLNVQLQWTPYPMLPDCCLLIEVYNGRTLRRYYGVSRPNMCVE